MDRKWYQDGNPMSFKIQVLYNEIPSFVKTRTVDTPFRFQTYEDALTVGQEIFNGVQYRIVGSSDNPHWQSTPTESVNISNVKNKQWYDIYGVAPSRIVPSITPKQPPEALKRLKPGQSTEGVSRQRKQRQN